MNQLLKRLVREICRQASVRAAHRKVRGYSTTTSETLVKVVGMREGKPVTSRPIVLLVRNVMPVSECMECEQPATRLCMECLIEEG